MLKVFGTGLMKKQLITQGIPLVPTRRNCAHCQVYTHVHIAGSGLRSLIYSLFFLENTMAVVVLRR